VSAPRHRRARSLHLSSRSHPLVPLPPKPSKNPKRSACPPAGPELQTVCQGQKGPWARGELLRAYGGESGWHAGLGYGEVAIAVHAPSYYPLMKPYPLQLEISGPVALWARPDTMPNPVSYVAPTFSAVKGIFEAILRWKSVNVRPTRWRDLRRPFTSIATRPAMVGRPGTAPPRAGPRTTSSWLSQKWCSTKLETSLQTERSHEAIRNRPRNRWTDGHVDTR